MASSKELQKSYKHSEVTMSLLPEHADGSDHFNPDAFRRPNPSYHNRPASTVSSSMMSLYEFSQPKQSIINAPAISVYDYPIIVSSAGIIACVIVWIVFGGNEIPTRPDVPKNGFDKTALGIWIAVLILVTIVVAVPLERKHHEWKQTRKIVKSTRSSWSKRPILMFVMVLAFVSTVLCGVAAIGPLVVHLRYEPWSHRKASQRGLEDWVGGDREWKRGEQLGAALFTSEGGILQKPTILALVAFALSIALLVSEVVQYIKSKPPPVQPTSIVDESLLSVHLQRLPSAY